MQTNILWSGREYYSLENCLVKKSKDGWEISSVIIGQYEGKVYKVEYVIRTDHLWHTLFFSIKSRHSNQQQNISLISDGKGHWSSGEEILDKYEGCIDIDIPLTPLTNTLPINRLKLKNEQEKEIRVIYLDLLENKITPVKQKYSRISDSKYHYENVPNDFEADIEVDAEGLVVDYPELFVRSAALKSTYK